MLDTNCNNSTTNTTIKHNLPDGTVNAKAELLRQAADGYLRYFEAKAEQEQPEYNKLVAEQEARIKAKREIEQKKPPPKWYHFSGSTYIPFDHFRFDFDGLERERFSYANDSGSPAIKRKMAKKARGMSLCSADGTVQITEQYAWLFGEDWDQLTKEIEPVS